MAKLADIAGALAPNQPRGQRRPEAQAGCAEAGGPDSGPVRAQGGLFELNGDPPLAQEGGVRPRRQRPQQTPAQRALGLLVRREHSRKELARKLTARGVEADEAASAVERLAGEGWQSDERFAEGLVRMRAGSGYGPLYIRAELATHGLGSEAISQAMGTFEGDWTEVAKDLVGRRFGGQGPVDLAQRRKAADLLARRGFPADSIRRATRFDPED